MPYSFLIIDDERDALGMMRLKLQQYFPDSHVLTAYDGETGLQLARCETPDLALVDAKMPGLDGYELCRRLRADPLTAPIALIMYTGYYDDTDHRIAAFDCGAEGFLCKPFRDEELIAQVKALLRARASEARYRAIVQDQTELVCRWCPEGRLTFVNDAYCRCFNKSPAELIGVDWLSLVPPGEWPGIKQHLAHITVNAPTRDIEHKVVLPDGCVRWQHWVDHGIFDRRGRLIEYQSVGRDITAMKDAENELREAKTAAEMANYAKSGLLAGISHELRTPLNAILGFSQVLEAQHFGPLNEKQHEYTRDIIDSGWHLLRLIDSILDISSIDVRRGSLDVVPLPLGRLLEDSLVVIRERCEKQGTMLSLDVDTALAGTDAYVDTKKIKQILFLLLSNAVKFTPPGGRITVSAAREGTDIVIAVADTGVGIAQANLEKIFDPFYQVQNGRTDKTPGVGLGLPLARTLVELHGGRLRAESEGKGKGSRFVFTLPQHHKGSEASDQ